LTVTSTSQLKAAAASVRKQAYATNGIINNRDAMNMLSAGLGNVYNVSAQSLTPQ
jgi:hypothetical protein